MPEPTNLSDDDLRAIAERALPHWGLEPERLELISRSENTVFRLDMPDGRAYALRVHRPGYHTFQELESELLWTQALNDAGIHVPVGRRTLDGPGYATIATPDGASSRIVGLVDWIEGVQLASEIEQESDPARIAAHFELIGRVCAAIHNQSSAWAPPAGFARHAFDVPGYVGDAPFWGRFWDVPCLQPAQREILTRARDQIEIILSDYGTDGGTYSLIHADLHPHNILVGDAGALHVIDFDDSGFGWHQYELAVALFSYMEEPWFDAITEALLAGYRSVRGFDERALELLPLFLLIRALVMIGWIWDRPELGYHKRLARLIDDACERAEAFPF